MNHVAAFFVGAFLCNSLPHMVSGLQGIPFPTPFAKPRGVGNSAPIVNFLWGMFNLLCGLILLAKHPVTAGFNWDFGALVGGLLLLGSYLACHFGKVQRGAGR